MLHCQFVTLSVLIKRSFFRMEIFSKNPVAVTLLWALHEGTEIFPSQIIFCLGCIARSASIVHSSRVNTDILVARWRRPARWPVRGLTSSVVSLLSDRFRGQAGRPQSPCVNVCWRPSRASRAASSMLRWRQDMCRRCSSIPLMRACRLHSKTAPFNL